MANPGATPFLLIGPALAGVLLSGASVAQHQSFHASWEQSNWQVEEDARHCALVHDIPRFGQARFEQRHGYPLQFVIAVDRPPVHDQLARLHSEAPPWQHAAARRALGEFRLERGRTSLVIPRAQALRLYHELEQGMKPVFEFSNGNDGGDQVQVTLLPVRFRPALAAFQQCTARLLHLDFEPLAEEKIYFDAGSDRLNLAARRTLEAIALKYRRQPNIRMMLGGHADARGDEAYNLELSRRRVAAVASYLRARGVSGGVVDSRYFGAAQSAGLKSSDPAALASHRNVTIWLGEASPGI